MQEIALGDADAEGIMSVDALLTAVGIEPLVGGHAVGETAQQPPPLIVDGGDVGIDDGAKLCDAGLMGQHIDRAAETAEGLHHRQITGNVHDGGQLEALQLLRPQQAVCQIGSAVGGDKAHLPGRVARQGQQAETDAAKVQMIDIRRDENVRQEAFLRKHGLDGAVGEGLVVGPEGGGIGADGGLNHGHGDGAAVTAAEIGGVAYVVIVGVGAENPLRVQAVLLQQGGKALPVRGGDAGVQQDNVRIRQAVKGDQGRGSHGGPCIFMYVQQLHKASPISFFSVRWYHLPPENARRGERTEKILLFPLCKREKIR